jgi:general secretion pathway protein H
MKLSPLRVNSRSKGFTLIEIMVVIIIIGIMTALTALNVTSNDPARNLKNEAQRFVAVVSQAVDEASFQQQELGIVVTEDGYQFVRWWREGAGISLDSTTSTSPTNTPSVPTPANPATPASAPEPPKPKWVLVEGDNTLRSYELPEGIRLLLELEESEFVKIGDNETTNGESEFTKTNLNLDEIGPEIDEDVTYEPSVYILSSGEMTPFVAEFFLADDSDTMLVVKGDDLGRVKIDFGDDDER